MSSIRWGRPLAAVATILLLFPGLAGCGRDDVFPIEQVHERDRPRETLPSEVTNELRFGREAHGGAATEPAATGMRLEDLRWAWDTPGGWEEQPEAPNRVATWRVAGEPETDCAFSLLAGSGGGVAANVTRWRRQMGLDPLDEATVAALPKRTFLGAEATYLQLDGTYGGMGGQDPKEGFRLLGLILVGPRASAFLKMTGPSAVLEGQRDAFLALAASIRPAEGAMPSGHPPADGGGMPSAPSAGLAWTAPERWVQQPPRPPRLVTFVPTGSTAQCYVTVMPGTAGGVEANLNMWCQQVGAEPLDDTAIGALPCLDVLGRPVALLEVQGQYTGKDDEEVRAAVLLGIAVPRDADTVFVKMVGPADEVLAEQANFVAFCESLREE